MFESTDDESPIKESVKILKDGIDNMKITTFDDKGHFTFEDLGTVEFSELLNEIIS